MPQPERNERETAGVRAIAAMLLCVGLTGPAEADGDKRFPIPGDEPWKPEVYVAQRSTAVLKIDGKLDEPAWRGARWSAEFVDIQGRSHPKPRHRTRVKMLWDASYLYVGARLDEPHLWATYYKRDSVIYHENDFEVFVDPDGDNQRYGELEINALGTVWDLLLEKPYRDGGPPKNGWDIEGLMSAVQLRGTLNNPADRDHGWWVELALPWTAFKELGATILPPNPGQQWRINFSRVQWRLQKAPHGYTKRTNPDGKPLPEDNWVWSPQGLVNMHYPERWGFIQFSDTTAGARHERFVHRSDHRARQRLMQVYYAQKAHYARHGKYAARISQLALPPAWKRRVRLKASAKRYHAQLSFPGGHVTVDQASKLETRLDRSGPAGRRLAESARGRPGK